jgi:hypothetical protein
VKQEDEYIYLGEMTSSYSINKSDNIMSLESSVRRLDPRDIFPELKSKDPFIGPGSYDFDTSSFEKIIQNSKRTKGNMSSRCTMGKGTAENTITGIGIDAKTRHGMNTYIDNNGTSESVGPGSYQSWARPMHKKSFNVKLIK